MPARPAGIFARMRTTSSFEIFPNDASERELAKARLFRREGRFHDAERAYRRVMTQMPGLRTTWTECFDLLRQSGRTDEALALADDAARTFGTEAFPIALRGAALIEQQRFPEALEALELAVERDPHLALTWHELGYAAYRIGDGTRALLALDRAFALEPHTETLALRGRILREQGEFYAATVAFEAAMHSATHDEQRDAIDHEIDVTQRMGDFAPRRPRDLTAAERFFAEHGSVVIAAAVADEAPSDEGVIDGFVRLTQDRDWQFGVVVEAGQTHVAAARIAEALDLPRVPLADFDIDRVPLLVADAPPHDAGWTAAVEAIAERGAGVSFVAWHPLADTPEADVIGGLEAHGARLALGTDVADAVVMAQHPKAAVSERTVAAAPP